MNSGKTATAFPKMWNKGFSVNKGLPCFSEIILGITCHLLIIHYKLFVKIKMQVVCFKNAAVCSRGKLAFTLCARWCGGIFRELYSRKICK